MKQMHGETSNGQNSTLSYFTKRKYSQIFVPTQSIAIRIAMAVKWNSRCYYVNKNVNKQNKIPKKMLKQTWQQTSDKEWKSIWLCPVVVAVYKSQTPQQQFKKWRCPRIRKACQYYMCNTTYLFDHFIWKCDSIFFKWAISPQT